jgi:CheY-like chemotaxis protein
VAAQLADDGHEVVEAADVAGAIDALARAPADAIVLDLNLRGESGIAVVRHVRGDPALARTPIVLLSGEFATADQSEASRYGVEAVLPKPFDPEMLTDAVARLLAGPGTTR